MFNKDHTKWVLPSGESSKLVVNRPVVNQSQGGGQSVPKLVVNRPPTKESKETIQKKVAAEAATPISLKEEIQKLYDSPRRDLNLIGWYFEKRKPDIRTKSQLQSALRRHLRAAKELSPFTDDQLGAAFRYVSAEYPEWTLETLTKKLTK